MATSLIERLPSQARYEFYNSSVRASLLAHKQYLINNGQFQVIYLDPVTADRFKGDFYGLLQDNGVSPDIFSYTLAMNDLSDPTDYEGTNTTLVIPEYQAVLDIVTRHKRLEN